MFMLLCLVSSNLFCNYTHWGSSQWDGEELPLWVQHKRCLVQERSEQNISNKCIMSCLDPHGNIGDLSVRCQKKYPKVSEKELRLCSKTHPPPLLIFASISTSCEKWQLDPVARDVQGASDGKAVPWILKVIFTWHHAFVVPACRSYEATNPRSHKRAKVGQSTGVGDGSYGSY